MGMGSQTPGSQVFYDPQTNQYYTNGAGSFGNGVNGLGFYYAKNYIGNPTQQQTVSPINDLLAKAAAAKPNAPTLAQLFPTMGGMYNNANGLLGGFTGAGQYGAGRFLGNNVMGNPSLTSTAMNVT